MNTSNQTRFTRTTFRTSVVVGFAAASMAVAGAMTAASAAHPTEGPGSARSAARPVPTTTTVSSPCFAVRTPDRWPSGEVGQQPQCEHVFGASESFGVVAVAQGSNFRNRGTVAGAQQARAYAARNDMPDAPVTAMDSACFMNPQHWDVHFGEGWPVCTPPTE